MRGHSDSCKCQMGPKIAEAKTTHGMSHSKTYTAWRMMISRCYRRGNPSYENYGGRGIRVCSRWLNSFEAFVEDMGVAPEDLSIDRIDNNGDYEPGNCRWADHKTQQNNKRNNILIEHNGEVKTAAQWAEACGLPMYLMRQRIKSGLTAAEILRPADRPPVRRRKWTAGETMQLRRRYSREPSDAIARDLGRTLKAVHTKAAKIGVRIRPVTCDRGLAS